jgi:curved DNA-binding protein CbpA
MENKTLYDILGVETSCSLEDIKNAYRNNIKKIHPDKRGDSSYTKILNRAYAILKDPAKRREYDNSLKIVKKSKNSFLTMKNEAKEFYEHQKLKPEEFEKNKQIAMKEFEKQKEECERRIGYDQTIASRQRQTITDEQLSQLEFLRDQEYIESLPNQFISDSSMTQQEFNEKFNRMFESNTDNDDVMIEYTGETTPFNTLDGISRLDETTDSASRSSFAAAFPIRKHNILIDSTVKHETQNKTLEERMKDRELETKHLMNMKSYEYKTTECINACGTTEKDDNDWITK